MEIINEAGRGSCSYTHYGGTLCLNITHRCLGRCVCLLGHGGGASCPSDNTLTVERSVEPRSGNEGLNEIPCPSFIKAGEKQQLRCYVEPEGGGRPGGGQRLEVWGVRGTGRGGLLSRGGRLESHLLGSRI